MIEPRSEPLRNSRRRVFWLVLRIAVTVAVFAYLFSIVDFADLMAAMSRVSVASVAAAVLLTYFSVTAGGIRWRTLLSAYGAPRLPLLLRLVRLHLVGMFYNLFLPGGVGGDVVRGVATRDAFGSGGTAAALSVVLVERAMGMAGLLVLTLGVFTAHPLEGVGGVRWWGAVGLTAVVVSVVALALGRRAARFLPGPFGRIAASLPELRSVGLFVPALGLSILTHTFTALAGHALVSSIVPGVALVDSFVVVPLAVAAGFFPLTVAGAGAREATFVLLYGLVGIAESDALAGSLAFLLCQMTVAATGGIVNMFVPLGEDGSP